MITNIPRSKLEPHPDNPRKDLGDLTDLAASIKRSGVLQNLTVVPSPDHPDMYRIVIGHRRHAAAGLAGVDELPCAIEDMSYADQVATMLAENMQRNDLTVTERVGGVQMMMNLGMDAKEISGNVGISETSVRRYAKLTKLDRAGMKGAEQRGATLMQFAEIAEIEYDDLRAEALDKVGTSEYNSVMYKVRSARIRARMEPLLTAKLEAFATCVDEANYPQYDFVRTFGYNNEDALNQLDKEPIKKGGKYVYVVKAYGIELYMQRKVASAEEEQAQQTRDKERRQRTEQERALCEGFKAMRDKFMEDYRIDGVHESCAQKFILWTLAQAGHYQPAVTGTGIFVRYLESKGAIIERTSAGSPIIPNMLLATTLNNRQYLYAALLAAYERVSMSINTSLLDSFGGIQDTSAAARMRELYDCMRTLGYQPSEEEKKWLDGTHPCFKRNEERSDGE